MKYKANFIFSFNTFEQASHQWLENKTKEITENDDQYRIVVVALPYFLTHINPTNNIFIFTNEVLEKELQSWKEIQVNSYPKQKQRIEETCNFIKQFFFSSEVKELKMIVEDTKI